MIFKGIVVEGKSVGKKMGFPTANILINESFESGIYSGYTLLCNKKYKSAIYIGNNNPNVIETHLIGFDGDLYKKEITIEIGKKIRNDMEFLDEISLKNAIAEDIKKICSQE